MVDEKCSLQDEEDLRIIDFREAFLQGAEPTRLAQPDTLRAPETIFTDHFDYRLDLWRAGIVVRRLHFQIALSILGDMKLTLVVDRFIRALWEDFNFTIGAT